MAYFNTLSSSPTLLCATGAIVASLSLVSCALTYQFAHIESQLAIGSFFLLVHKILRDVFIDSGQQLATVNRVVEVTGCLKEAEGIFPVGAESDEVSD